MSLAITNDAMEIEKSTTTTTKVDDDGNNNSNAVVVVEANANVEKVIEEEDDDDDDEDIGELQDQYDIAMKLYNEKCITNVELFKTDTIIVPTLLSIIENMNYIGINATQIKEKCMYTLVRIYCCLLDGTDSNSDDSAIIIHNKIPLLLKETQFLSTISKAKTAKLVRQILDIVTSNNILLLSTTTTTTTTTTNATDSSTTTGSTTIPSPSSSSTSTTVIITVPMKDQESITRSILDWCIEQKRSFLRQRVEAKLAYILYKQGQYVESLKMVDILLHELKQLDDKQLLVDIHLLESQLYFSIRNISKSKAALTASRTAANSIYVSPIQQAALDSQSGTIHTEETDYNTAHSYFLEAFEQLDQMNDYTAALKALKYMMLCKILDGLKIILDPTTSKSLSITVKPGSSHDSMTTSNMVTGKQAIKYAGKDLDAMQAIGKAVSNRNLKELHNVFELYKEQLSTDLLIQHHIHILQEQLLESNLLRIVEPYSCIEIHYIAMKIELPIHVTERKLSQMILDGTLNGILDQGKGQLILYETIDNDDGNNNNNNNNGIQDGNNSVASKSLEVIQNMDSVVTSLFERSKALRTVMM